ncbi:hypothetical protein ACK34J_03025 [Aeromonas veronii]
MDQNKPDSTSQLQTSLAIENRCKIIIDRQWPQHEIDKWLALLTPEARTHAINLLQAKQHIVGPIQEYDRNALTDWIEQPTMFQADLSDAELKRAIWKKADEDKGW